MELVNSILPSLIFGTAVGAATILVNKTIDIAGFIRKAWIGEGWDGGSPVPGAIQMALVAPATNYVLGMSSFAQYAIPSSNFLVIGGIAAAFALTIGNVIYWRISHFFNEDSQNMPADFVTAMLAGAAAYFGSGIF